MTQTRSLGAPRLKALSVGGPSRLQQLTPVANDTVTVTTVLVCGTDGKGIDGRYLYVEDRRPFDYFGLCEVAVFAEKGAQATSGLTVLRLHF